VHVEPGAAQLRLESRDPRLQVLQPLRIAREEIVVTLDEPPADVELLRERLAVIRREDVLGARDQRECRVRVGLQRHARQPRLDRIRQLLHLARRRLARDRERLHANRLAEEHQGGAAEDVFLGVVDPGRHHRQRLGVRTERDARGARLQLAQARIVVRRPLGEDGDAAAAPEHFSRAGERLLVRAGGVVLFAVDRDGVEGAHEKADDRIVEQRRLRQERHRRRRVAQQEQRIDETIRMIDREDQRALGNTLEAEQLDPAEEDAQAEAEESGDGAAGHAVTPPSC
jgi:hypothetical protein